jgi:predicted transcriptional regulator
MTVNFKSKIPCQKCAGTGQLNQVDGTKLRKHREAKGQSLRSLAKGLGFSAAYISDIERNRRACTDEILEAYASL